MSWTLHAPVLLEILYTLAKEKLNMNTFTKTLIASAMAIAVAGPAAADVPSSALGAYTGSKTDVKITPSGCKNGKLPNVDTVVGFGEIDDFGEFGLDSFPFAGCWAMTGYSFDEVGVASGLRIARKVDNSNKDTRGDAKDVTMSLSFDTLYEGIVDQMDIYLQSTDADKCNYVGDIDARVDLWDAAIVKKADGKFSKNQAKLKVDIRVDSKYENTKGKFKNIKASVKGKMDFSATEPNPAFDCGLVFVDPQI